MNQEILALKFAQGKISLDKMARLMGKKEAQKVAYFVKIAKKSLKEGL